MNTSRHVRIGRYRIERFRFLLLAVLAMIGVRPFLDGFVAVSLLADLFLGGVLVSGVYALSETRRPFRLAAFLAAAIVIVRGAHHIWPLAVLDEVKNGLVAVFFAQLLAMMWGHIRREKDITADLIAAAACGYLLLGLVWGHGYAVLEAVRAGSFKASEPLGDDLWDFYYYSFVTLTTLGYGDITAATKPARGLTVVEAVTGQLYLAILVGRLVGMQASQGRQRGRR